MVAILDFQSELFLIYKSPWYFISNVGSTGLSEIYFPDGGHLGFHIGIILAIFAVQAVTILPTKFRVN